MAVFMQPAWDARIAVPGWATGEALKVGSWREGMTFAEFSEATYQRVYG